MFPYQHFKTPFSQVRCSLPILLYLVVARANAPKPVSSLEPRDELAFALHSMGLSAEPPNRFQLVEESANGTEIDGVSNYLQQNVLFHNPSVSLQKASDIQFNFQLLDSQDPLAQALQLDPGSGSLKVRGRVDRESLCADLAARKPTVHTPSNIPLTYNREFSLPHASSATSKPCVKRLRVLSTAWFPDKKQPEIKTIPIEIHIEDINDSIPKWLDLPSRTAFVTDRSGPAHMYVIELQLPELSKDFANGHSTQSTRISLPLAHDPDDGLNGRLNYRIEPIPSGDRMVSHTKASTQSVTSLPFVLEEQPNGQIDLVATTNLDYEKQPLYQFYLFATDTGSPARTGTALVKVHLVDINDEAPVFDRSVFYPAVGAVSEKTVPGTLLLNLSATDSDASIINNRLRYSMVPNNLAFKYFTVHPDGRVTLRHWLDYESMESAAVPSSVALTIPQDSSRHVDHKKQFVFQVVAIDSAPQPYEKTGTAMVIIPVIDENDEAPVITVRYLGPPDQTNHGEIGAVLENSGVPTRLAYIQVRDPDFEGQDQVACHLSDSVNFSLTPISSVHSNDLGFAIEPQEEFKNDFILNLLTKADRELTPLLFVRIKCLDQVGNANEQTLRIRVLDVNDERPKFSHQIYRFMLPENTNPGNVEVDTPTHNNHTVQRPGYRIGRVSAQDTDHGSNAKLIYRLEPDSLQIVQAKTMGQPLGPVQQPLRNAFVYRPHSGQKPRLSELFDIEPETGVIRAMKSFDAENVDLLRFKVSAVDQPDGEAAVSYTGSATVEVKIADVNDWSPMFYQVNSSVEQRGGDGSDATTEHQLEFVTNYVFKVKENRPAFWLVGRVAALDPDVSQHWQDPQTIGRSLTVSQSVLSLRIANDAEPDVRNTFSLHATSGHLRTVTSLDREAKAVYVFHILASDSNKGSTMARTATATVTVFVEDENDNSPVFVRPITMTKVNGQSGSFNSVIETERRANETETVPGSDSSTAKKENQLAKDAFGRMNRSGVNAPSIGTLEAPVPFVVVHKHTWTQQTDGTGGQQIAHGRPLLQLEATDADTGENGMVTYHIGAGNHDGLFHLDNTTGTLMLSADTRAPINELARASTSQNAGSQNNAQLRQNKGHLTYLLRFEACDHGMPKRCALPIWVRIMLDMNDFTQLGAKDSLGIYSAPFSNYQPNPRGSSIGSDRMESGSSMEHYLSHGNAQGDDKLANSASAANANQWSSGNRRSRVGDGAYTARFGTQDQPNGLDLYKWSAARRNAVHERNSMHMGQPATSSLVISEAVIICLVVIFIVLMCAASVLIYLVRRKVIWFGSGSRNKMKRSPCDAATSTRRATGKYTDQSASEPLEMAENSSVYQMGQSGLAVLPDGTKRSHTTTPDMSQLPSHGEALLDHFVPQPLVRRNSDSRLAPYKGAVYGPSMIESIYVGNGPCGPFGRADADYQSLLLKESTAVGMANSTKAMSRSVTPFCELGSKNPNAVTGGMYAGGAMFSPRWRSRTYHNPMPSLYRMNSPNPLGVIRDCTRPGPYPMVRDMTALTSSLYASQTVKQPAHLRGSSTPVYSRDADPSKWHVTNPTLDNAHTYHELSTLTATLRRHNYPPTLRPAGRVGGLPTGYNSFQTDHRFIDSGGRLNNDVIHETLEDISDNQGISTKPTHTPAYGNQSTEHTTFINDMLNQSINRKFAMNALPPNEDNTGHENNGPAILLSGFDAFQRTDTTMKTSSSSLPLILDTGEEFATPSSPEQEPVSNQDIARLSNKRAPVNGKYVYDAYREASFV